jgi:hypothetical protein
MGLEETGECPGRSQNGKSQHPDSEPQSQSQRNILKRKLRIHKTAAYFQSLIPDFLQKIGGLVDIGL